MTDNEIIKALGICSGAVKDGSCRDCPRYHSKDNVFGCSAALIKHSLSLINRQKAEIESLNSRIFALNDTNKTLMDSQEVYWRNKVKEFAERLKEALYRTEFGTPVVDVADIDNLVKEMVGGDDD